MKCITNTEVHADELVKADGKGQGSDPFLFCLAHKEKSSCSKAGLKLIMHFNNIRNSMEAGSQRLNSLTPDQPSGYREANGTTGWGERRVWEREDRQKLRSLSKSRKKFGPCSNSVQVSTFNRFPIWFLQEREKRKKGGRARVKKGRKESCLISDGRSEAMLREAATEPRGGARKKEERRRGRRHSLESRGWRREKTEQSRLRLLLHLLSHRPTTLTFKVQEKVWIVLYFPC